MLQPEFEERFGKKVSPETYNKYNTIYMWSELDKDTFVALYKKLPEAVIDDLSTMVNKLLRDKREAEEAMKQLTQRDEQIAVELLKADDHLSPLAERLTSQEYVVRWKLEEENDLSESDRKYLLDIMSKQ